MTRRSVHSLNLPKQVCDAFKDSTHYIMLSLMEQASLLLICFSIDRSQLQNRSLMTQDHSLFVIQDESCVLGSLIQRSSHETTITAHICEMHTLCGLSPRRVRDGWMVCILNGLSDGIYILYAVSNPSVKNDVFHFLMLPISFTITI